MAVMGGGCGIGVGISDGVVCGSEWHSISGDI